MVGLKGPEQSNTLCEETSNFLPSIPYNLTSFQSKQQTTTVEVERAIVTKTILGSEGSIWCVDVSGKLTK